MKLLIKLLCLCSLVLFSQVHLSEQLQMRGRQLAMLRNLPHRYLGMLYYSWLLQPHRTEYLREYAVNWYIATSEDERYSLLEATTNNKPVVPLLIAKASGRHADLRLLSKKLVYEEQKKYESIER